MMISNNECGAPGLTIGQTEHTAMINAVRCGDELMHPRLDKNHVGSEDCNGCAEPDTRTPATNVGGLHQWLGTLSRPGRTTKQIA